MVIDSTANSRWRAFYGPNQYTNLAAWRHTQQMLASFDKPRLSSSRSSHDCLHHYPHSASRQLGLCCNLPPGSISHAVSTCAAVGNASSASAAQRIRKPGQQDIAGTPQNEMQDAAHTCCDNSRRSWDTTTMVHSCFSLPAGDSACRITLLQGLLDQTSQCRTVGLFRT